MNKEKCLPVYSSKCFLNHEESPSTGSIAAFIGYFPKDGQKPTEDDLAMWLRISDCHQTVSLHKCDFDSVDDFIEKIENIRGFLNRFIYNLNEFKYGKIGNPSKSK